MNDLNQNKNRNMNGALWAAALALFLATIFTWQLFTETPAIAIACGTLFLVTLALLYRSNRESISGRTVAFGVNSAITTLLVIAIIGVMNFLVARYPQKLDLTRNKIHTLSDQTEKVVKGLKQTVKANYFSKIAQREQVRPLLDNLSGLNPKFEVEYIDPDKEPTRARQAGIRDPRRATLQLVYGNRDAKVDDVNEEKLTNALIKVLKEKPQTLCAIMGHGEKNFGSQEQEGLAAAKTSLTEQSYVVRDVTLAQETKVPADCDAIAIIGPTKSFFEPEIKAISEYLASGGRAVVALDENIKGTEYSPELNKVLTEWYVQPVNLLIVDPYSKMLGVDAAVPILATYSKDSAITKDFQNNCFFPFARSLDVIQGAPAGLHVQWLAQTTPKSWGETNFQQLATGRVQMDAGVDRPGPLNVAMAVEGKQKDSKATRNTRLVVFGTSAFATNNWSRFGGNLDLFMNAVSWLMEDESLISIRAKEEGPGKVELTQRQGTFIALLTIFALPLLIAVGGVVVWVLRRRM